jgi:hypothetical protein
MKRRWRAALALAASLSIFAVPAAAGNAERSWLDRAIKWVEQSGQVTVIHRRFCRHIELRCPPLGVDTKFVTISDEDGEHDLSVVQKYPKVVMIFSMNKGTNILFAMHSDGSIFRVIKIDVVSQDHIDLPADADKELFERELAFWQRRVPVD